MRGYPHVVAVHAGRAIQHAQPVFGPTPTVVLAAQGGRATADLNVYDMPLRPTSPACASSGVTLQVTPPGAVTTLTLTMPKLPTCDEQIKPVQPGPP